MGYYGRKTIGPTVIKMQKNSDFATRNQEKGLKWYEIAKYNLFGIGEEK